MPATESERKWTPGPNEDSVSKRSTYPDNQQLFVGNLPHSVTDKELQEFFERKSSGLEFIVFQLAMNRMPSLKHYARLWCLNAYVTLSGREGEVG